MNFSDWLGQEMLPLKTILTTKQQQLIHMDILKNDRYYQSNFNLLSFLTV